MPFLLENLLNQSGLASPSWIFRVFWFPSITPPNKVQVSGCGYSTITMGVRVPTLHSAPLWEVSRSIMIYVPGNGLILSKGILFSVTGALPTSGVSAASGMPSAHAPEEPLEPGCCAVLMLRSVFGHCDQQNVIQSVKSY